MRERHDKGGHELWCIFDLRFPGAKDRLGRELAGWKESGDVTVWDNYRRILRIRPGGASRLLRRA